MNHICAVCRNMCMHNRIFVINTTVSRALEHLLQLQFCGGALRSKIAYIHRVSKATKRNFMHAQTDEYFLGYCEF